MTSDLQALRITWAELDQVTGLDIGAVFMGGIIRPSVWRSRRQLLSLVITESLVLGTIFIVCVGLGLVLVRQQEGFDQLGGLLLGLAGAIAVGAIAWHLYQWQRSKTFITLARLLDECDRHNDIIQALQVMAELESAQVTTPEFPRHREVLTAMGQPDWVKAGAIRVSIGPTTTFDDLERCLNSLARQLQRRAKTQAA